jgi:hypothetical protein
LHIYSINFKFKCMTARKSRSANKVEKVNDSEAIKSAEKAPEIEDVQENEEIKVAIIGQPKLSVVIPYFAEKAQGIELLMAIRSIEENFHEDFQLVIIGDKPEWLSDEAIFIDAPNISKNAGIDTLNKIKLAIADNRVSDHFIMTYDDIYFTSPVMLADIQFLVANGMLSRPSDTKTIFHRCKDRTISMLEKHGFPTYNYDTHTPYYFEKEKLVQLLEAFEGFDEDESLLLSSVYFNYHYCDFTPMIIDNVRGNYLLRLISESPDPKIFQKYIAGKKFLNNSVKGYNKILVDYLNKKFPQKSKFEV